MSRRDWECTKCGHILHERFRDELPAICPYCKDEQAELLAIKSTIYRDDLPITYADLPVKYDMVSHPPHYTQGSIQPIDYIMANKMSFLEGNVVKYVTRHKLKGGLEDLNKATFYLNKLKETYGSPVTG